MTAVRRLLAVVGVMSGLALAASLAGWPRTAIALLAVGALLTTAALRLLASGDRS